MAVKIIVPALGESITEATIARWVKKQGDAVIVDELILELETEKVTLEVNAPASGVLSAQSYAQGSVVKVGDVVGEVTDGGVAASPVVVPVSAAPKEQSVQPSGPIAAPSAQKIAAENNVSLANTTGTGKDGRITKGDVLEQVTAAKIASSAQASAGVVTSVASGNKEERVKMSRLRKTIAQRLKDSQNTAAILTTFNEIDMFNVIALRQKYKEEFEKKHGIKLGFMSFFVKAVVAALKELPAVNAEIDGDDIIYKNYYDIGVAVGTDSGLVVPVVRDADLLSLSGIESTISGLGKKAREGKLSMADMTGGTFSITNGGVYGSLMSTPIINPPQSGILGMHKTMDRPVAINGKVEIHPMMYVALSYDHRMVDGKEAVTFLVKVKEAIENPERLLLNI